MRVHFARKLDQKATDRESRFPQECGSMESLQPPCGLFVVCFGGGLRRKKCAARSRCSGLQPPAMENHGPFHLLEARPCLGECPGNGRGHEPREARWASSTRGPLQAVPQNFFLESCVSQERTRSGDQDPSHPMRHGSNPIHLLSKGRQAFETIAVSESCSPRVNAIGDINIGIVCCDLGFVAQLSGPTAWEPKSPLFLRYGLCPSSLSRSFRRSRCA